jgi:hypothetical protein
VAASKTRSRKKKSSTQDHETATVIDPDTGEELDAETGEPIEQGSIEELGPLDEIEEPAPAPTPSRRKRRPSARVEIPAHQEADVAPQEELEPDFGPSSPWGAGPSPLEMTTPQASAFVEVERINSNGPDAGFMEGSDYTGPLASLAHTRDLAEVIRRRYGGGEYRCRGAVNGKIKERRFSIGGPSKEPDQSHGNAQGFGQGAGGGFVGAGMDSGYGSSYDPYGQATGFQPQPPYSPYPGYPPAPHYPGAAPYADPFGYGLGGAAASPWQQRFNASDTDEVSRLREEAAAAREQQRIMELQHQHQAEKARLESALARIEERVARPAGGGVAELMQTQMQLRMQAEEVDRKKRQQEWEAEQARIRQRDEREQREREEQRRREEQERRERIEREERERKDRIEREDRERKYRMEQDKRDREERQRAEERQAKSTDMLMQLMAAQASKPMDTVNMIAALKDIASPQKDTAEEIQNMVSTMAMLKEVAGDGGNDESQAERLIRTVGETVTPAIGEIASIFTGRQAQQLTPQQTVMAQQQALPMHPEAPVGAIPLHDMAQPAPVVHAQAPAPAPPPPPSNGIANEHWGEVLKHVVDCRDQGQLATDTVRDLFTVVKVLNAVPIIPELANNSVAVIRGKVNLLVASRRLEGTQYHAYAQRFLTQTETAEGQAWLHQVLTITAQAWQAVQQGAAQAQQQAAAPQQVHAPQQQVHAPQQQIVQPQAAAPIAEQQSDLQQAQPGDQLPAQPEE